MARKKKLEIGSKVMIAEDSEYYGSSNRSNPSDVKGKVIGFIDNTTFDLNWEVNWGGGYSNYYTTADLVVV